MWVLTDRTGQYSQAGKGRHRYWTSACSGCRLKPTHFQMKTLKHVSTEMSLHVLAYNLKRMLQIFGAVPLMEAMRAWQPLSYL